MSNKRRFYKMPAEIMGCRNLKATSKLVFAVVKDRIGQHEYCWVGMRKLAEDTSLTRPTVSAALAELEEVGLLLVERRGDGRSNHYRLPPESGKELLPVSGQKSLPVKKPKRSKTLTAGGKESLPEPAKNLYPNQTDPLNHTAVQQKKPVLSFPTKGGDQWELTQAKLNEYQETYAGIDVLAELRRARQWCIDNPGRRKTARGMPKFCGRMAGPQGPGQATGEA